MTSEANERSALRATLRVVIALNLAACAVEIAAASVAGSVALFADSVDFLEDASINALVLAGLVWSARARAKLGMVLAGVLLAPTLATAIAAWQRFATGTPPEPAIVGVVGLAALGVNTVCAILLTRHRNAGGSLLRAAFLSARNDTIANVAIIAAAGLTALTRTFWPDLLVGLGIGLLNAGAAWEVWDAARDEHCAAIEPEFDR